MREQPKWPGLWTCRDYDKPLNARPPFSYKCHGMEVEPQAAADFNAACHKVIQERN